MIARSCSGVVMLSVDPGSDGSMLFASISKKLNAFWSPAIALSPSLRYAISATVIWRFLPLTVAATFRLSAALAIVATFLDPFGRPFGFPLWPGLQRVDLGVRPLPTS